MSRTEWYVMGYLIWLTFGLIGVVVVMTPYRMGLVGPPSLPWLIAGFVGGLIFFVALELVTHRET